MCGIVAYYTFKQQDTTDCELIRRMTDSMAHRGPDSGVWCENAVGLGHRRLAIIDLSPASRGPFQSEGDRSS